MKLGILVAVLISAAVISCAGGEPPLPEYMSEISLDPPFLASTYCLGRFCPEPLGGTGVGRTRSYDGWVVTKHYAGESGHSDSILGFYSVELIRQSGHIATSKFSSFDRLAPFISVKNDTYAYRDKGDAHDRLERETASAQPLPATLTAALDVLGYDEGRIELRDNGSVSLWIVKGRLFLFLQGFTGMSRDETSPEYLDAAQRSLIESMSMLLAIADRRVEPMILSGSIYLDGELLGTSPNHTGIVAFLTVDLGPYELHIQQFAIGVDTSAYVAEIRGTEGMKGRKLKVELSLGGCRNPACELEGTLLFESGTESLDLHFNRPE